MGTFVKSKLLSIHLEIQGIKRMLQSHTNEGVEIPFWKKISCFSKGYMLNRYELYHLYIEGNTKRYIPDCEQIKTGYITKPYDIMINDKQLFYEYLADTGLTSQLYGFFRDGKIWIDNRPSSIEGFLKLIEREKRLIIKRSNDGGGKGIYRIEHTEEGLLLDHEPVSYEMLMDKVLEKDMKYLITEWLDNGEYCRDIYDGCTNSLRFMTIKEVDSNEIHVVSAYHKFGMTGTGATDNCQTGGLCFEVDRDTGVLGKGFIQENGKTYCMEKHPDTQVKVTGRAVPNWKDVLDEVKKLHMQMPFIHYAGWDVVVTEDKIRVIECNNNSGLGVQFNQPFNDDPKMKKFMKYHGVS